jgi:type I restriction enzyme S subunit
LTALCDRLDAARARRETTSDQLTAASLARLNTPDPVTFRDDARFALDSLPILTARPDQIKQLRQTILNLAVRGKLVPHTNEDTSAPSFGIDDEVEARDRIALKLPIGWAWARVRNVASARLGKMLDRAKNAGKAYRYLRNTNVHCSRSGATN